MICKSCHNRVPDKDAFCVSCGRVLRPGWVNWLALVLIAGALLTISPVVYSLVVDPVGDIASRFERTVFLINGWCWLLLASAQAIVATYLLVLRHSLLRNLVLAVIGLAALAAFSVFARIPFIGLPGLVVVVVVLVLLFRRRG